MIQGARNANATPIMRTLHISAPAPCSMQRLKGDDEQWAAHFSNYHFKSFGVAVNGSAIHHMVSGLHCCDQVTHFRMACRAGRF